MPLSSLRSAIWRHPRLLLALKTAIAAAVAWAVVQPLGGFVADYPYYAPLGVVVATSTSIVASVRTAAQAVAAIFTGAALAVVVEVLPVPGAVAIGIGIGIGMVVAAAPPFGSMGSWVPLATLFVLIIGGDHPWRYAAAYGGLTALGAGLGIAVNLALPQLPLRPAELAQHRLRGRLADQLERLADGLRREDVLSPEDWEALRLALIPEERRVEELVQAATESRQANWLAPRWAEAADRREEQARALQRLTGCVDHIIALVGDTDSPVHADDEIAGVMRARLATAMLAVAHMLRTVRGDLNAPRDPAAVASVVEADLAVTDLAGEAGRVATVAGGRYLPAAAVAVALRQAVEAWS
ncbi:MAG: hypothetical protein ACXVWW_07510 [Nocardioides sp.]